MLCYATMEKMQSINRQVVLGLPQLLNHKVTLREIARDLAPFCSIASIESPVVDQVYSCGDVTRLQYRTRPASDQYTEVLDPWMIFQNFEQWQNAHNVT